MSVAQRDIMGYDSPPRRGHGESVMHRKHGSWVNIKEAAHGRSVWPASTAVSTSALVVSAEQSGHFTSVRGTDKIVGGSNGERDATTSPQTVQVHRERDLKSGQ